MLALLGHEERETSSEEDEEIESLRVAKVEAGAVLLAEAMMELRLIREAVAGKGA
ncbi:hypothetical protein K0U83_21535 [bacterium]|nr:hypothetical protein [bacterium]